MVGMYGRHMTNYADMILGQNRGSKSLQNSGQTV